MVAPDREASACSQSLTLKHPLRAEKVEHRVLAVDGTPADCVNLAIVKLLPRRPVARRLGHQPRRQPGRRRLLLGHRGRRARGDLLRRARDRRLARGARRARLPPAARFARRLAALVLEHGLPERTLLNVNVPPGQAHGRRDHRAGPPLARGHDPRGPRPAPPHLLLDRGGPRQLGERRDVRHLRGARRASSRSRPLQTDTSNHRAVSPLREWQRELPHPKDRGVAERVFVLAASSAAWYKGCSFRSGRGSAWLERLVRDQEVGGSNPLAPTTL